MGLLPTLILWGHALAALLFGVLALRQIRRPAIGLPPRTLAVALSVTALWALAVAGIDPREIATRCVESARNLAWLALLIVVARRRHLGIALGVLYATVAVLCIANAVLGIAAAVPFPGELHRAVVTAWLLFRLMAAIGMLLLVHDAVGRQDTHRPMLRLVAIALATIWALDAVLFATAYIGGTWPVALVAVRGLVLVGVAALLGVALDRGGDRVPGVSRTAALRLLAAAAAALYVGTIVILTDLAAMFAGEYARVAQTGIVFGATAALLTLISRPWLRAWARVKVAKHLFAHRYDYREEWQRFTETLGRRGAGNTPLGMRIVKAIADLTDSPAGLLLVPDGAGLGAAAAWNREQPTASIIGDDALASYLSYSRRIIELDAVRADVSSPEAATVPAWILAERDAWAIVPLVHGETLAGAVLLARPPVDRALDWEDLDLLRVAGRQAASYLAEDRARAALADAERFDEFNRRFAFILHDIKNLVSQQSLVARNVERHADNPAFRTDMIATLKDSATRMTALLARLSPTEARADPPRPVDLAALLDRIAAGRRSQHPVVRQPAAPLIVQADPVRLEQVLSHLVQNAIEASGAGDPVRLDATLVDGRVAIDVIDSGQGMAPEFVRDRLFRPFVSTKPGGFGIGAFEARQLVAAMNGTLEVTSRLGEGTRFRILLPLAASLEAAA